MNMNALFIDDKIDSVRPAMDEFKKNDIECKHVLFDKYKDALSSSRPDIIVLDMMDGGTEEDSSGSGGKAIHDDIWERAFCPIIIYSANPDLHNADEHPFVKKVRKGSGSESVVLDEAKKFQPYLSQYRKLEQEFAAILNRTLRDTAPVVLCSEPSEEEEIFLRITRRRIAAEMDCGLDREKALRPYEQYIYPAIGKDWLQGDIIKHKKEEAFFLVLTPSCDLVKRSGKIKANTILCAKCYLYDKKIIMPFLKVEVTKNDKKATEKDKEATEKARVEKFTSLLNSGIVGHYFVLPKIGTMPDLLANLKDFCLITEIDMKDYQRIVSIDSPFREQLGWVFVSVAGRPGVPDRDFSKWASDHIRE